MKRSKHQLGDIDKCFEVSREKFEVRDLFFMILREGLFSITF